MECQVNLALGQLPITQSQESPPGRHHRWIDQKDNNISSADLYRNAMGQQQLSSDTTAHAGYALTTTITTLSHQLIIIFTQNSMTSNDSPRLRLAIDSS